MAAGISIHIGLEHVDPNPYGSPSTLKGCGRDAADMQKIARSQGFCTVGPLLNGHATACVVKRAIRSTASMLRAGDTLLITCSAHGAYLPDLDDDEVDSADEAWCLYDRPLLDDELYALWARFPAGVRILLISDTCYSGSMAAVAASAEKAAAVRSLSRSQALRVHSRHSKLYRKLRRRHSGVRAGDIGASLLLLSACQEDGDAYDDEPNGVFTAALLDVWADGGFQGNHLDFHREIYERIKHTQQPGYVKLGVPNPEFELERPFTI